MATATKKVSVVVPCRNEKDFIASCIHSIINGSYSQELLQIIVCDGLSDDGTMSILEDLQAKIPVLEIVVNEKKITPVARNIGIQQAIGEYIVIFDAHAEMAPDYIIKNAAILDQRPEVWCSGGIWKNCYTNELSKNIARAMSSPFGVGNAGFRTGQQSGYTDTVGMPMYRSSTFQAIGLFDEALIRNQDDEFNYRVAKAGGRIWLTTDTWSNYYVRPSWKRLFSQYFQYGYWKVYVNKKHRTVTTTRQLIPVFFTFFLAAGVLVSLIQLKLQALFAFVLLSYTVIGLAAAMRFSKIPKDVIQIFISFFILHFSYGTGYAKGILDFLIRRKQP